MSMELLWETFVPIKPERWQIKARRLGQHASIYTPANMKNYQDKVVRFLKSAYRMDTIDATLAICIVTWVPRPKTVKRKYPTTKPDNTNYQKIIEDCLTKAEIIKDDSLVILNQSAKLYHETGKVGTDITILKVLD